VKRTHIALIIGLLGLLDSVNRAAAQGTAFNYQGEIADSYGPVSGSYDFQFKLYDASSGGIQQGTTQTKSGVPVSGGLFTVNDLDFGNQFDGNARWLEVWVRPTGPSAFTQLAPRQTVTPVPYAIFATAVPGGGIVGSSITADKIAGNQVVKSLNGLQDAVTLSAGANVTLTPSGNTLTIASAGAGGSGIWSLNGSSTYYNGGNVGIGTTSPSAQMEVVNGDSKVALNPGIAGVLPGGTIGFTRPGSDGGAYNFFIGGSAPTTDDFVLFGSGGSTEMRLVSGGLGSAGFGFYLNTSAPAAFDSSRPTANLAVKIDGAGNVGIGTASPGALLDVQGPQGYERVMSTSGTNGAVLELRNNAYGVNGETLGSLNFTGPAGNRRGQISYYENDASGADQVAFTFMGLEAMHIAANGVQMNRQLLINTDSGAGVLEVNGGAHRSNNSSSWDVFSDRRLKRDIVDVSNGLATVDQLRPVRFRYTEEYVRTHPGATERERLGVIAQEFQKVFPEYVSEDKDGFLSVDVSPMTFYNTAAIQELHRLIEDKTATITALEEANAHLQRELAEQKELTAHMAARFAVLEKVVARIADNSTSTLAVNHQSTEEQ
jgi:hypothetical protein